MIYCIIVQETDIKLPVKSTSSAMNRILVHIKNLNCGAPSIASFKRCVFEQLGILDSEQLSCEVQCYLEDNKLYLEKCPSEKQNRGRNCTVTLKHPAFCPMKMMSEGDAASLPDDVINRGVNVGVVVVLEAADDVVLLTRRAAHMRTFPGVWVPPGGHIELNESLEDAGLRELREETGLSISPEMKRSSDILALWESVFPPILGYGLPKRHHIVVYWHILLDVPSSELENSFQLNPDEVAASVWLPGDLVQNIVSGTPLLPKEDSIKLKYLVVNEAGDQVYQDLDPKSLEAKMPTPGQDVERMTTGTRYALEMLDRKKKKSLTGKSNL